MKEDRDDKGERQKLVDSCWSVYSENITVPQMFSSTQRKRERVRRDRSEEEQQKDVSDWRLDGGFQVGLIMVYFMTQSATWLAIRSEW